MSQIYPDTLLFTRTRHLVQNLHIFNYLRINNDNDIDFDKYYHCVSSDQYIQSKVQAMKDLYVDFVEEISQYAPKPRGKPVQVNCFNSSYHAGNIST